MRQPGILARPAVPVQVISGFLGAGKTTLLQQGLRQKPAGARWAVVINEFGQIGLDAALLDAAASDGLSVRELAGGCLCCSSRLPLELTLGRLLREHQPERIWIEPTGLAEPEALLALFAEPHWQGVLSLRRWLTLVDGSQLLDARLTAHPTFLAQLQAADVVLLTHQAQMQPEHWARWSLLRAQLEARRPLSLPVWLDQGEPDRDRLWALLDQPHRQAPPQPRPLLTRPSGHPKDHTATDTAAHAAPRALPWHYQQQALGMYSAGWQLPPAWQFGHDRLLVWLLGLGGWTRIKGVLHTDRGWLALNLTPASLGLTAHGGHTDNRLEVMADAPLDWTALEQGLLGCRVA